jgi:DeoR/GlpR family transcriptional regulator of sugar metabolism
MSKTSQNLAGSAVLVEERRQRVLDVVSKRGFVALADLASDIGVSESTIRRDLDFWTQQGVLRPTRGGAVFLGNSLTANLGTNAMGGNALGGSSTLPALDDRISAQLAEKQAIARLAASRIRDGDSVLLDGGSTTLEVARLLIDRDVQIVTNSLPIATLFATRHEADLILLGGYVYPRTGVALGPGTVRMMEDLHVNQAVLSVGGITEKGLFNSNILLVETERQMMRCADEVVVVADHTKIGRPALAYLCEVSAIDTMIVDDHLTPEQRQLLEQTGVRIWFAHRESNEETSAS